MESLVIRTPTEEIIYGILFCGLVYIASVISIFTTNSLFIWLIDGIAITIVTIGALPSRYQFKYQKSYNENIILLYPNSYFLRKRIELSHILLVSFVSSIYTPIAQLLKKREYSDVIYVFICYKRKKKIKGIRILINREDEKKLKTFFKQRKIKIIPSDIFEKSSYNCQKFFAYKNLQKSKTEGEGGENKV